MRILTYLFLIVGLFCLGLAGMQVRARYHPDLFTLEHMTGSPTQEIRRIPTRLHIPAVGIDVPIIPSIIRHSSWEISSNGVSYLSSSSLPGTRGNSILYGHNWPSLLGSLKDVQTGDVIEIYYTPDEAIRYIVENSMIVSPDQHDVLNDTMEDQVTIYTCISLLDSERLVVTGRFDRMITSEITLSTI